MSTEDKTDPLVTIRDEDEDSDPEEYNVEKIVARRKNPKTGGYEYLIKWENYSDSENTWEPSEHLKCPDLIAKFNEAETAKRKRRNLPAEKKSSQIKKNRGANETNGLNGDPLLVEDREDDEVESGTSKDPKASTANAEQIETLEKRPKGFERGLPIERIVGSCTDDNGAVWFFIKWRGYEELELVEVDEIEQNAPKELCVWYRERLYHTLKSYDSLSQAKQHMSQAVT